MNESSKSSSTNSGRKIKSVNYFLSSKRLGFRYWKEDDLNLAFNLWGNPEVTKLIDSRGKLTYEEVKELLTKEIETQKSFGIQYWPIFLSNTNEHIGCSGLRPYDPQKYIFEIGTHILPTHWRNGYALEATLCVIDYAFHSLNCSALFAGHNPKNNASKKLLEKLKFNYIRDEYYEPTGLNHPSYLLTKEEYVT
ncbi:MAG: GNAT family N-acetyltransferase [Ignavibacterium sp.]|nr:MAG: GNAT family N-acetyltransferase [Ignavibacterium sp.]